MTEERKQISKEEALAMAAIVHTEGWRIYSGWIENARQTAEKRCAVTPDDHRYYQGIAAGIATVEEFIRKFTDFANRKEGDTRSAEAGAGRGTAPSEP